MLLLPEMVATVTGWINSCNNDRALAACQDTIDEFVDRRYKNHVSPRELAEALDTLRKVIEKKATAFYGLGEVEESAGLCESCSQNPSNPLHMCSAQPDRLPRCNCCPTCEKQCRQEALNTLV